MGYATRGNEFGHRVIKTYWPDDTDSRIYRKRLSFNELVGEIAKKWPTAQLTDVVIGAERIQTDYIDAPHVDNVDYTEFVVITNIALEED